jgi:hypothetical protein
VLSLVGWDLDATALYLHPCHVNYLLYSLYIHVVPRVELLRKGGDGEGHESRAMIMLNLLLLCVFFGLSLMM